jgi:hypothetical protein
MDGGNIKWEGGPDEGKWGHKMDGLINQQP